MTCNRRKFCHLTEIWTLAIRPLTLHNIFLEIANFPAISRDLSDIFEDFQNVRRPAIPSEFYNRD